MSFTIFVTAPRLASAGVALLEAAGARVFYLDDPHDAAGVERVMATHRIDAVISRTVALSAAAIEACPTLKVVAKHGVGVGAIDVAACTRRGIPVFVTPGANAQSAAELTIGLMLAAARKVAWMDREIRAGRWSRAQDGVQLAGRTLGLVGFGQVARRVARIALAMDMTVKAHDRAGQDSSVNGVEMVADLDALIASSDVLSLHVPLTEQTRGLLSAERLALMRPTAILINTARGEVVDEAALAAALASGRLWAAGLDTLTDEPLPHDSPLRGLPNVVITPHVGGSTPQALAAMAEGAASHVLAVLAGGTVDRAACINAEVLR